MIHKTDYRGGVAHVRLAPLSECHEPMKQEPSSYLTAFVTGVLVFAIAGLGVFLWVALP